MNTRTLLAIDWGTSSLRGALLDAQGQVCEERSFARGILTVAPGEFSATFDDCFGDWMKLPGAMCLMAGMVGSKQGWREAPYCSCPAGFEEVAAKLVWLEPDRIAIVPGLCCETEGIPDVIRGEETQIFGALQLLGLQDALLVLPGTHSKWVQVKGGRIDSFATFMTGEFFALLRQHSILSRTLPEVEGDFDSEAFNQGVRLALRSSSLLQTAFSTRTLALFDRVPAPAMLSYLSGLVIGDELRAQTLASGAEVIIIGSEALTLRYQMALSQRHVSAKRVGSPATWTGLWAIAQSLTQRN
jgi:2-dehydro-3-deoxygalactonokinase